MKDEKIRIALWKQEAARKNFVRPCFLDLGLTLGQGQPRILKALLEKGPQNQKELAELCGRDAATVSRTLDRMEAAGLLERVEHPSCRRSYLIHLTAEGRRVAEKVKEIFAECDRIMFRGLSEEEKDSLSRILEKITANLESDKG